LRLRVGSFFVAVVRYANLLIYSTVGLKLGSWDYTMASD